MTHRALMVLVALLVLAAPLAHPASPAPVEASGPEFVWIYHHESGRLVQVAPGGLPSDEIPYPLPPDVPEPPYKIAFSRDARYLAGCLRDAAGRASVRVYDFSSQSYVAAYHLPDEIVECSLARYSFSADGTTLAFGVLNHYGFEPDPRPTWELRVLDLASGSILHHIQSDSPQIVALGVEDTGKLPIVVTYEQPAGSPGLISFIPVQWATEGMCEYPSLLWDLGDDSVRWEGPYGYGGLDALLGSGEFVWVEMDPALPTGLLEGPGCAYNVVKYAGPTGDVISLFHNGTVLSGTTFVDNGRVVLVNSYVDEVGTWIALERDGTATPLPGISSYQVWGTSIGYVFIDMPLPTSPAPVQEVRFHTFTGSAVPQAETAWTGAPGEYWRIVWAPPLVGESDLAPFVPGMASPPPPDSGPLTLAAGGRAQVHTTGGDPLRARTGPGLGFDVAFHLQDGAQVTIVEGPVSADGLVWWRLEFEGRSGWAVEGIQESTGYLTTLMPLP